jgi:monothiol glutaredoxin
MAMNEAVRRQIDDIVRGHRVVLFMKGNRRFPQCGFSQTVVGILDSLLPSYETVNVLADPTLRDGIKAYSEWPTIPQLYVDAKFVGGCDIVRELHGSGELGKIIGAEPAPTVPPKAPAISISKAAADAILAAAADAEGDPLRLEIDVGFRNDLYFGKRQDGDVEVTSNGVAILFDPASAARADGVSIDYTTGPAGAGFKITNPSEPPKVIELTPQELKAMLDRGEAIELFDVRTDAERSIARIEGARPLDAQGQAHLEALDKKTPLVFHCHHGVRSQGAAEHYLRSGFARVYNLRGGIDAWSAAVDAAVPRY